MIRAIACFVSVATVHFLATVSAHAAPFTDVLVQSPRLGAPERGSVGGALGNLIIGTEEVSRGSTSFPLPVAFPNERGPLLANPVPSYSIDGGLSEWGMGWGTRLSIQRHRPVGHLAYDATDEFLSPWGRLVPGEGGAYFPANLSTQIAIVPRDGGWVATTGDGVTYTFLAADAVTTSRGTFEWPLSRVNTVLGDSTQFTWSQTDAYPYLTSIHWGKRGDGRAYEANLTYENVEHPWTSFAPGIRRVLGQRVKRVSVQSRDASGRYSERWRYDFVYTASPIGASYYLTSTTRTFASGESEPTTTYDYDLGVESMGSAAFVRAPRIDPYLQLAGPTGFQPDKSSITDIDDDGRPDLEYQYNQKQVHQTEFGLELSDLPARTGTENPLCRPTPAAGNQPRVLARLDPDAKEPQVLVIRKVGAGGSSSLYICDRKGNQLASQTLSTNWEPAANTRLADIDGDLRPDLVRVQAGSITIALNDSSLGTFHFAAPVTTTLALTVTPLSTWITDENGDGLADLFVRWANGVVVLHGMGHGLFEATASVRPLYDLNGQGILHLSENQFTFGDFNKDGLIDLILTRGHAMVVLTNRGTYYQQVSMTGLSVGWDFGLPVNVDLSGSGETEVVVAFNTQAWILRVTTPGMGLLSAIHDNKGNHVHLAYERGPAWPGGGARPSVLQELTVTSSGQDPVSTQYEYAHPVVHTKAKFLMGYETTRRISPFVMEETTFHHDDDISGVVTATLNADSRSTLFSFSAVEMEEASYLGVRLLRAKRRTTGLRSLDGARSISELAEVVAYERGICTIMARTSSLRGTLEVESVLAEGTSLDERLNCLHSAERMRGVHADADSSYNFEYLATMTRNEFGQILTVSQVAPSGSIPLQQITYDARFRVETITEPGEGTTRAEYDPTTGIISSITSPDQVRSSILALDPISDAMKEMSVSHGPGSTLTHSFRHDGQERLWKQWDDMENASEASPKLQLDYAYASDNGPGVVRARSVVTAGSVGESAVLHTAAGQAVATMSRVPGGWVVGGLSRHDPNLLETETSYRGPLAANVDPFALSWAQLRNGAQPLGLERDFGTGGAQFTNRVVRQGVSRVLENNTTIEAGLIVKSTTENGMFVTTTATDLEQVPVWSTDADGNTTYMYHDALSRLRRVVLPDGAVHSLTYDEFGRPLEVSREGLSKVHYVYGPGTSLLQEKQFMDGAGVIDRRVTWTRDLIGRPLTETDTKVASGHTRVFTFAYDGDRLGQPRLAGQVGYLSEVGGPGFQKHTVYNRDGSVSEGAVHLDGFREIAVQKTYYEGGATRDVTTVVRNADGRELYRIKQTDVYDSFGRLGEVRVDGDVFASFVYDAESKVERIDFADGRTIANHYDPLTRAPSGYWQDGGTWNGGVDWLLDARGHVTQEVLSFGDETWSRDFDYNARGFLTRATDRSQESDYEYSRSGRLSRTSDATGVRVRDLTASHETVGAVAYDRDGLGRVIRRGDLTFEYGPSGQVEVARRGSRSWSYLYDENGERLMKLEGSLRRAAYVGGTFVEPDRITLPVRLGGRMIGAFVLSSTGKHFEPLATDPRGTVIGDEGVANLPTPYGARAAHPSLAAAIDFVEKGFDADLGIVRMGVRDYDPNLGEFLTADPLFLESIDDVANSPVEGSLFNYARGNPILFVDPDGTIIWIPVLIGIGLGLLGSESDANAPTRPTSRLYTRSSYTKTATLAGVGVASSIGGGQITTMTAGAGRVLSGVAGGTVGGLLMGVGGQAADDLDKGHLSSPGTYVEAGAKGALTGALLGGLFGGASWVWNRWVPQGLSWSQWLRGAQVIRDGTKDISDDVFIQGSRAGGTARPNSDIDIGVRVSPEKFDELIQARFKSPNPGSAKWKTMQNAIKTGKIQAGEAGLRGLRKQLQDIFGMDVDVSIIKAGGAFDNGPTLDVPKGKTN